MLIACPPHSCYSVIEAISNYYRDKIKSFDSQLGYFVEQFVKDKVSAIGVNIKSGEYVNSDKKSGEIDTAIEFDDLIVLIETKKKSLTKKSKSGHWLGVINDVHKSLLDSQYQALGHEYSLLKDKEITFKNGEAFQLNDRPIEKISMILFDYGAIQDRTIIRQLLPMYLNCTFSSEDAETYSSLKELYKKCLEYRDLYLKYESMFVEKENIPFFGCWFLSVSQLLILLDGVKDFKDFKKALWQTRHITMKTFDWYYEYSYVSSLKEVNS